MRLVPEFTDEQRVLFVAAARSLLTANGGRPVRFRHQGRTLRGLDCIGACVWSVRALGVDIKDRTNYGRLPANRKLAEALEENFGPPVQGLKPADIVSMSWGAEESHVAIVTQQPERLGLIHCYRSAGHVIEHGLTDEIRSLITAAYRP